MIHATIFLDRDVEVSANIHSNERKAFACVELRTERGSMTLHSPTPEVLRALAKQCQYTAADLETWLEPAEAPKREYVCQRCNGTGRFDLGSDCETCKGVGVEHG